MRDSQSAPRRKLKVDFADLVQAMDFHSDEGSSHLDLRTGEIHVIDDDLLHCVEDDELDDLPAWQKDLIDIARAVLKGDDFLEEIPHIDSAESFDLMRDFVARLDDGPARRRLEAAVAAPRPFRRFKDALFDFPELRERWFELDNRAKAEMARRWLDDIGVELIEP